MVIAYQNYRKQKGIILASILYVVECWRWKSTGNQNSQRENALLIALDCFPHLVAGCRLLPWAARPERVMGALSAGGVTQFWWELDSEARNHVWVEPGLPRKAEAKKREGIWGVMGRERKQAAEQESSSEKVLGRLKAQSKGS